MAVARFRAEQVIPEALAREVEDLPYWFVIGGHAVRCFCPYRPSVDVDFGVGNAENMADLVAKLSASGDLRVVEKSEATVHARWNGINISIFLLEKLVPFTEAKRLTLTGILATKLHAVLDRGTRRDFFDLYVTLQQQRLGILAVLNALREVYRADIDDGLLLRALTYFDDAEREAALPGEGEQDWESIKKFFRERVGTLITPPGSALHIQSQLVDVRP